MEGAVVPVAFKQIRICRLSSWGRSQRPAQQGPSRITSGTRAHGCNQRARPRRGISVRRTLMRRTRLRQASPDFPRVADILMSTRPWALHPMLPPSLGTFPVLQQLGGHTILRGGKGSWHVCNAAKRGWCCAAAHLCLPASQRLPCTAAGGRGRGGRDDRVDGGGGSDDGRPHAAAAQERAPLRRQGRCDPTPGSPAATGSQGTSALPGVPVGCAARVALYRIKLRAPKCLHQRSVGFSSPCVVCCPF